VRRTLVLFALVGSVTGCTGSAAAPVTHREPDVPAVATEQVEAYRGSDHCGWESVTFVAVGRPGAGGAQYVRDPEGAVDPGLSARLRLDTELPDDAEPTGFETDDGAELWLSESDPSAAYLRDLSGDVEAWPRADPPVGCD
jgi:hypothetical protein